MTATTSTRTYSTRTVLTLTNGADTVTGSSGYEAILPACYCEGRTPCPKPPEHSVGGKTSVDAWLSHAVDTCHEWHLPGRVETFANDVLKTYPRAKKTRHEQPALFADIEGVAA